MSLNPDSISGRIHHEVDERWKLVLARLDAETAAREAAEAAREREFAARAMVRARSTILGFFTGLVVVLTIATTMYGFLKQAAIDAAQADMQIAMDDYANFKRVATNLLGGVSEEVARVQRKLGQSDRQVAALFTVLDRELEDPEIEKLNRLLTLAGEFEGQADFLLVEDEVKELRELVDKHEAALSGTQAIDTLKVEDLVFRTLVGQREISSPSESEDLWFLHALPTRSGMVVYFRSPDDTVLQQRVSDGGDAIMELKKSGRGRYETYVYPDPEE